MSRHPTAALSGTLLYTGCIGNTNRSSILSALVSQYLAYCSLPLLPNPRSLFILPERFRGNSFSFLVAVRKIHPKWLHRDSVYFMFDENVHKKKIKGRKKSSYSSRPFSSSYYLPSLFNSSPFNGVKHLENNKSPYFKPAPTVEVAMQISRGTSRTQHRKRAHARALPLTFLIIQ